MNRMLNLSAASSVLAVDEATPILVKPRESKRSATGAKNFCRIRPSVWGATELVAAALVILYLFAAGALSGAMLFYTFSR